MTLFFRCVAEAVMENGLKGLVEMVPGWADRKIVLTAFCIHTKTVTPSQHRKF